MRWLLGPFAVLVGMMPAGTATAGAVTTVGSDLSLAPTLAANPNSSFVQLVPHTGTTLPVTAPADGVIVAIRISHGATPVGVDMYGFRVLSLQSGTTFTTNGAPAELPDFDFPDSQPAGITTFNPTIGGAPAGIPISAGQYLGLVFNSGSTAAIFASGAGANLGRAMGTVHNSGPLVYGTLGGFELLMQFDIEPDADHDHFGDETQDQCPTDASTQGPCPKPASASAPTATGERAAALAGCRKRAKKHNWSHRRLRKCKRKANLLPV